MNSNQIKDQIAALESDLSILYAYVEMGLDRQEEIEDANREIESLQMDLQRAEETEPQLEEQQ